MLTMYRLKNLAGKEKELIFPWYFNILYIRQKENVIKERDSSENALALFLFSARGEERIRLIVSIFGRMCISNTHIWLRELHKIFNPRLLAARSSP